jgi:O-antigen ligase
VVVIATALLLSRSRAGNAAALAGVAALMIALTLAWGRGSARGFFLLVTALLVGAVWVAGDALFLRLDGGEIGLGDRPAIWGRALAAIADRPLTGHGLGAYPDIAHLYRDATLAGLDGTIDQAHSTYLELAAEVGAPLTIALVCGFVWLAVTCLGAVVKYRPDPVPAAAGFAATIIVGLHSIVDFSLQIPAVTLTYLMLAGAGLGRALGGRTFVSHSPSASAAAKRA